MTATDLLNDTVVRLQELGFGVEVDAPDDPNGETFLDISKNDFFTQISFRPHAGLGVFISDDAYGQRPDEVYRNAVKAANRVEQLFKQFEKSGSVGYLTLLEMRKLNNLSQVELAQALSIKQPSVNRIEKRENIKFETLAKHVAAMGGRLEMRVVFDEMEARLEIPTSQVG
ncbi:DNA-binding XRE family transcriptional regulator [Rhizobium tibeticum]|uniref:helix-turn-helix domain-containing protein n=1 Tax=Rhizobium tibeticum TaxID=501024 RepID=UPI002780E2D7|nr:helix-turn-helix transcriptional regulator [Rhizobium tibeticum]MDP9813914.1 DNA-binding XRE family transcriptional regulator [Rhizobium tibeticum]